MPPLNNKWFKELGNIHAETARKLHAESLGHPISQTLTNLGWHGELVAGIALELAPDNNSVLRGEFFLRGIPSKDSIQITASDLWKTANADVTLSITLPEADRFKFNSGTLVSEYVAGEDYNYFFKKGNNILVPSEWAANNVGETVIRAVCHLDKASNGRSGPQAKATFLIFPCSKDDLIDLSDATQSPAWPGFRVLESTCKFFPNMPEWKDPIAPLIILGSSFMQAPNLPSGQEIRFHISAIMRSARRPTTCTKGKTLFKQWTKATEDVEQLEQEPTITWPVIPRHQPVIGNNIMQYQQRLERQHIHYISLYK